MFGYGLLAGVLFLVPGVPGHRRSSREKVRGTLALLLNSPMSAGSIYVGKLAGVLGFAAMLLVDDPARRRRPATRWAGSARGGVWLLYVVLAVAAVQLATLALLVSGRARSTDGALRTTYALVAGRGRCCRSVPHWLLAGDDGTRGRAGRLGALPVAGPGGHGGARAGRRRAHGLADRAAADARYFLLAGLTSLGCAAATVCAPGRGPRSTGPARPG